MQGLPYRKQIALVKVVPEMFYRKELNYCFDQEAWDRVLAVSMPDPNQSVEEMGAVGKARLLTQEQLDKALK